MAEMDDSDTYYKCMGLTFDIISAVVSLLDLSTDIVIMITWYSLDRMIFFWISITILIFAQLSYISVFYFNHGTFEPLCLSFISLLCTLPFAPILSFIFYLVADDDAISREYIDDLFCYNFSWNSQYIDQNASPQKRFLENKLYKHLGFVLEALIEAFPQSILQLTAIVYYNEPNAISIISILISMTSVCSKILLLSASGVNARGWKLKIFIWLSFVVDFLGAFFIVSFAFYTPSNIEYQEYFTMIQNICIWEFIICIFPFAIIGSIGLHLFWVIRMTEESPILICCWFLGVTILWIVGLFMTFLIMSIFTTIWAGFAVMSMGTSSRLPYNHEAKTFYQDHIEWILNANDTNDKIVRLCLFNKTLSDLKQKTGWNMFYNEGFCKYLDIEEKSQFKDCTIKKLRISCKEYKYEHVRHTKKKDHRFWTSWYYEYYGALLTEIWDKCESDADGARCVGLLTLIWLTWITGPIYGASRFFNVFLPFIVVLYLYVDGGIILFVDIDIFQLIMWSIYVFLLIIWCILFCYVANDEYYLWWIAPHSRYLKAGIYNTPDSASKIAMEIQHKYEQLTVIPWIEKLLHELFGGDIGKVVLHYFISIQLDLA